MQSAIKAKNRRTFRLCGFIVQIIFYQINLLSSFANFDLKLEVTSVALMLVAPLTTPLLKVLPVSTPLTIRLPAVSE